MSEIKLNIVDALQTISGNVHGSEADALVAALSAEPETVAELEAALARFIRPTTSESRFSTFRTRSDIDEQRWDSGVVVIDLASRTVAIESTYSRPGPNGVLRYHDGTQGTDIPVHYQLSDDWLFVYSLEEYKGICGTRRDARDANPPLDARAVLYGRPLLKWIVETINSSEGAALWKRLAQSRTQLDNFDGTSEPVSLCQDIESDQDSEINPISVIHARWLMTPRDDLRGLSPREVIFAKRDIIDFDMNSREMQWSLCDEGPPCLSLDSFAYRFAGFGTHEWVIYYDMVRHLIWSALLCQRLSPRDIEKLKGGDNSMKLTSPGDMPPTIETSADTPRRRTDGAVDIELEIVQLEEIKTAWLERPQHDYDSRTPAILIGNERKRLPIALQPRDMIVDENCPTCRMFADESALGLGVGFWHLDGSNMDDDFAFSYLHTREEWEAERREWAEFSTKFNREWEEKQQRMARGDLAESDHGLISGDSF